jgi:hypothetical protein
MPLILGVPKLLPLENMSQMPSAVITHNLRPHHAERGIGFLPHSPRHSIPERRPSAPRVELVIRFVQRRVASRARVDACVWVVLIVCTAAGWLGALLAENAELF